MNVAPARARRFLLLPVLLIATALPLLAVGTSGPARAVPGASNEIRVNTTTASLQSFPAVAVDADGDSVVVWESRDQDGSGYGVYAQRYDSSGVPQGNESRVNTVTAGDQRSPSVAMDVDGNYVVTWESMNQDGSGWGVYSRRFFENGVEASPEMRVNATTGGDQLSPTVAIDADGEYVIAWTGPDQDGEGVFAQRFTSYDRTEGAETRINTTTVSSQVGARVAMDADGDYVIAWESLNQDGSGFGIYSQRFSAAGAPRGTETRVNTGTASQQVLGSVAMAADGDYVVAWASEGQDGSDYGIYSQRFSASGVPRGVETRVNTTTAQFQYWPSIAMDASGDYVIAWASDKQDSNSFGVYAQRYDATGTRQGTETRLNTTTAHMEYAPRVAMDADGDYLVAWESSTQAGVSSDVHARRFRGPQQVDLTLAQAVDPAPVPVGGRMEYRLRVSNVNEPSTETGVPALDAAIGAATAVRLRITPPDGATLASYTDTFWTCVMRSEVLTCRYTERLAADQDAQALVLTYTAGLSAGPVQHVARVSDGHVDPVPDDNSVADRTVVMCTVEFDNVRYTKTETGDLAANVVRRGFDCGTSSVRYETAAGSATPGSDYTDAAGTLHWGDSDPPAVISVPVVDDALDEPNEQFRLLLSQPGGVLLGNRTLAVGLIFDNDDPPRINFVTTADSAAEPGALVEVTARLSEVSGRPVTVTLAKAGTATLGSDYHAPARLTIPAGQRSATFTVEVLDDAVAEGNEVAVIALAAPVDGTLGSQKAFRLTITDND